MFNSVFIFLVIFISGGMAFYLILAYLLPWIHRKKVASYEIPEAWDRVLNTKHPEFLELSPIDQEKVRSIVKVFMAEKYFEPDNLKWDQQIQICAYMALGIFNKRHKHLSKLSTIKIGKKEHLGQGFIEVSSVESLKNIEYDRWF